MPAHMIGICVGVGAFDQDTPGIGKEHGGYQLQNGCFSTAVGTQQNKHLATGNSEGDPIQGMSFSSSFPAHPVKHGGAVPEDFADRLEDDTIHFSIARVSREDNGIIVAIAELSAPEWSG
jgi:hypothetical protein